ncbi:methyltransferase [Halotia wernerae UHCC 0503]|nr:methyltransferase [Halotia wernerae UHCC 0503]
MLSFPTPACFSSYWNNSFQLEPHLQTFLNLDPDILKVQLIAGQKKMSDLGQNDFQWETATEFYHNQVGTNYLFDLASFHLQSQDYIRDTLCLIADQTYGKVLDFGGGLGTHAIAAAFCPDVTQVIYCDINPIHCEFVKYRTKKLGLEDKLSCYLQLPTTETFDTILCFDVLEHLPDPSQQLLDFYHALSSNGKLIVNWYFSQGLNNEFPFHIEDTQVVEKFFWTIQRYYLEVFHPYLITSRCYKKLLNTII